MFNLLSLAISPTLICLFYIYIRDKYEKEPWRLLITGLLFGMVIIVPVIHCQNLITVFIPNSGVMMEAFYSAFVVASFVEEIFKFLVLYYLVWYNKNFNEPFDGIVYSVFVSLGFAGVENILYITSPHLGGMPTALARAVFSVPGHMWFGVAMGYYFAMSKFMSEKRLKNIFLAFFIPFLLHGAYNFILLSGMPFMIAVFILFSIYMWRNGLKKIKTHISLSPFKETS